MDWRVPTAVIEAYNTQGCRDLAETYVLNMERLEKDPLLDYQERCDVAQKCLDNFVEAFEIRKQLRQESMTEYVESWKDQVANFNI